MKSFPEKYARQATLASFTLLVILFSSVAQATFSIVAVDTVTGAVGSAGASCIAGSKMINDLIPNVGGVNTQAYYISSNQANAHGLLAAGLTADSIIGWLKLNDVEGTPDYRQYGVVTLTGPVRSAGYTGAYTDDWKGHKLGPNYAIQGNILLGPQILDTIELAFLTTAGSLEEKLMAALEAANVRGADTRCTGCNKPAISAYIRVMHPGDETSYLYQYVDNTICSVNPIPLLRQQFDTWTTQKYADPDLSLATVNPALLGAGSIHSAVITITPRNHNNQPPIAGAAVTLSNSGGGQLSAVTDNGNGTFSAAIAAAGADPGKDTIIVTVIAGGQTTILNQKPVVTYYRCGDANGDLAINVGDAVYMIQYIFRGGPAPVPSAAGDANGDGKLGIGDAVYVINYIFKGGPAPVCP